MNKNSFFNNTFTRAGASVPSRDTETSASDYHWVEPRAVQTQLISVSHFATVAGITPQAVRKMIAEQRIRSDKVGNQHSIPKEELDEYLSRKG